MRTLCNLLVAGLLVLPLAACEQGPTGVEETTPQLGQMDAPPAASHNGGNSGNGARHGTFTRPMWGDGHLWEFRSPKQWGEDLLDPTNPAGKQVFGSPSNENAHAPFFVIGPDAGSDGVQSSAFLGPHDHVANVPKGNAQAFNANWHIHLVVPAPGGDAEASGELFSETIFGGLAHAADTDGDLSNGLEQLTSVERVEKAYGRGNVLILATDEVFVCPVRDIEG